MKHKDPIWLFYSALDDEKKTSIRCLDPGILYTNRKTLLDCNAEVSAKVLRLKSHCEKCQELIKNKTKSKPVKRPFEQIAETINP